MLFLEENTFTLNIGEKKMKSKSEQALDLQEAIQKKIDKLSKIGFEFMYYNGISSVRRQR